MSAAAVGAPRIAAGQPRRRRVAAARFAAWERRFAPLVVAACLEARERSLGLRRAAAVRACPARASRDAVARLSRLSASRAARARRGEAVRVRTRPCAVALAGRFSWALFIRFIAIR
jgi:hypothetical protein